MHSECVHLGEVLRVRREEKHISLKEVENATSVRLGYLQAIEEGDLGKLISPIYAQGFIKKYAAFLELDGEVLLQQHPYVMRALSEKPPTQDECFLGSGTIEVRGSPGGEVKWLPNLLWVVISAAVIVGGWFLARHFGIF